MLVILEEAEDLSSAQHIGVFWATALGNEAAGRERRWRLALPI